MATATAGIVACISRRWELQDPLTDFNQQLGIGLVLVFEAIAILASIAIAASTRLGQIPTLLVCVGVFIVGLVGEYFLSLATSGRNWLRPLAAVVPNLQFFWPADALAQGNPMSGEYLALVTLYAACLIGAVTSLAIVLFQTRDVG